MNIFYKGKYWVVPRVKLNHNICISKQLFNGSHIEIKDMQAVSLSAQFIRRKLIIKITKNPCLSYRFFIAAARAWNKNKTHHLLIPFFHKTKASRYSKV